MLQRRGGSNLSLYKRGDVWWFKFRFEGQVIRESAKTGSKTVARDAERTRRRDLELAVNRIQKRERMPLFSIAAREWLAGRTPALAENTIEAYSHFSKLLVDRFGQRLICDIGPEDIAALQRERLTEGKSARTVNFEINTLRQILKAHGLWGLIADRVKGLRERKDVGKAVSFEDERKLLDAIGRSRSPALLPLFVLSLDSGLRASEVRALRRRDLRLEWKDGVIVSGELTVPKSKTEAGTGRIVPLTRRVCASLSLWLSRFPEAQTESYVFPRHRVGFAGDDRHAFFYDVDLSQPAGEWKKAWKVACRSTGVSYRWHDCRHSFVTRLAENPNVSEETIKALAGHVSKRMLERYSHIRTQAKVAAIAALERATGAAADAEIRREEAQNWAQSSDRARLN
jgi:integrase